ncbi:hypothetical protein SAMN05421837_10341 [Amycolatopsis pretoriensis]|uniref:Uncharacterized protein n=1 Tax=Amycolatopsis pretoriensis TaxID=218821 RepID=A0A1H5QKX4_9PSEU|nr:hypothetical protein [Amycolatopsis pretoriensis]SEF26008.1 hypothetical protein SAMN05421837_10341 [Amycolatopsis pretoriensis]
MVAIAATARWRARIVAAAASAGITLTDPLAGVPGIRPLACTLGDLGVIVPRLGGEPSPAAIGAHSDSIADRELRDAVADVAALLSLHGNVVLDLDAGGRHHPDVVVSAAVDCPQWTEPAVTLPVGTGRRGGPLTVALTAGPGFEGTLLELARLVEADAA